MFDRLRFSFFLVGIFAASAFAQVAVPTEARPPAGSWEQWTQNVRGGATPPRPDGLALMAALPAWVDCHLSWWVDKGELQGRKGKMPPEIILRATPKICEGELEQWAH